jgi:hypothetical protein
VTEKVAPSVAFTHYNEYLAKNLKKTNQRDQGYANQALQLTPPSTPDKCVNSIDGATFSVTPPMEFTINTLHDQYHCLKQTTPIIFR